MSMERHQLWAGCYEEEPSSVMRRLNDSFRVETRMFREDIRGSQGWAAELHSSGHLSNEDNTAIQDGLREIRMDMEDELFKHGRLKDSEEDIHSVIESRLVKYAGVAALNLHTARSRSEQSLTDTKLWMLTHLPKLKQSLQEVIMILVDRAENEIDIITSGCTQSQPIRWAHFLLSHAFGLQDDIMRLAEQFTRMSRSPLGSGDVAGCVLPINRKKLAESLGFSDVTPNSLFAVSSRDYLVEFLNWASLCGIHLSRLSEDLTAYSNQEFGIISLAHQFSSESRLMPQTRSADGLELVRMSVNHLVGDAFAFSCALKGLPTACIKDLQSNNEILLNCYDRLSDCIKLMDGTMRTMTVNRDKALISLDPGLVAAELAEALVRRGITSCKAHEVIGAVIHRAEAFRVDLINLPHKEYVDICPEFGSEEELKQIFSMEASVEQYASEGGTAKSSVLRQIQQLRLQQH